MSQRTNHDQTAHLVLASIVALTWCILWLRPCSAAEYEERQGQAVLRVEADKNEAGHLEMRLSDELRLTVRVEGSETLEVQLPSLLTSASDWQVKRETVPAKTPPAAGPIRWTQSFRLAPLRPGELSLVLAPLRFHPSSETDLWQEVTWKPIPIHVSTEISHADLSELRDIAPPEELRPAPSWGIPLGWTGLGVVFVLLLLNGWALLRWRRRGDAALPPDQWALLELERLRQPMEFTEQAVETFYTQLSDILRRYVELRYHVPAPEQTTAEFLEALRNSPQLQPEQQALLRDFLEQCDLVKFARVRPTAEECGLAAQKARVFVEETAGQRIMKPEPDALARNAAIPR
jgi:hypothetical protein